MILNKRYLWNKEKNSFLKRVRNISFEQAICCIEGGFLLDIKKNKKDYPKQLVFIVDIKNYVYMIPFLESETEIFLKTIIPTRKLTKIYLGDKR